MNASRGRRIVLIGTFGLQPKGTMRYRALPLARALAVRGHQVTLLLPSWDDPRSAGRVWREGNLRVVHVPLRGGPPAIFARMLAVVRAVQPEIVHVFKPKGYAGAMLWLLWHARRVGFWRGKLVQDADDWETGWNEPLAYSPELAALFAWQERWCLARADVVTVASRWLKNYASGLRASGATVFHVPNGMERLEFSPQHREVGPPTLLLYTRFFEVVPTRIVRVWRHVLEKAPTARLIVAGDSVQPGAAAQLRDAFARENLSESTCILGWTPKLALHGVFAAADAAWVPAADTAVNRARCSVKLVELLAVGLPVVADDVGEASTYVQHGVNGFLVAPADDAQTVTRLTELLTQREQTQTMASAAQTCVAQQFVWEKLVGQVEIAYALEK